MAAPGDQRIAVPIDDPNADTEWYNPLPPWPIASVRHLTHQQERHPPKTWRYTGETSQSDTHD